MGGLVLYCFYQRLYLCPFVRVLHYAGQSEWFGVGVSGEWVRWRKIPCRLFHVVGASLAAAAVGGFHGYRDGRVE